MKFPNQELECSFPLSSPFNGLGIINARGIEFDPRDSNIWVSDYSGNIYKVVSCDSRSSVQPPPPLSVPGEATAAGLKLSQNVPNPFTTTTTIAFTMPSYGRATLRVYDATGKIVRTLADEAFDAGEHSVTFDAGMLPSGVYRYALSLNGAAATVRTMVHVK